MTVMIDELVNRFLGWKIPKGFSPDGGISFDKNSNCEPIGTNLFSADQAKAMFEYCLNEEPVVLNNMSNTPEQVAKYIRQNSPDISKELAERFKPQALLSQGEPADKVSIDYGNDVKVKQYYANELAPPSLEALQKANVELFGKAQQLELGKAELIEYAEKLHNALFDISLSKYGYGYSPKLARDALAIPQPKFLENW